MEWLVVVEWYHVSGLQAREFCPMPKKKRTYLLTCSRSAVGKDYIFQAQRESRRERFDMAIPE